MFTKVFISLGTNLGKKRENLYKAIEYISNTCGIIKQKSRIYSSEPWGYQSFNNYLNQVIEIETVLAPEELIEKLLKIEELMGRKRDGSKVADRIIDLDILFYNDEVRSTRNLKIPHPRMHERNFVILPMVDLDKNFIHPTLKKSMKELKKVSTDKSPVFIV